MYCLGLSSTPHEPTKTYPRTLSLFDSHAQPPDPFDNQSPAITLHSQLHARALLTTVLRILISITHSSASLVDYTPTLTSVLVATWPVIHPPSPSNKGKQRAEETQQRVLAASLGLVGDLLERPAEGFVSHAAALVGVKVAEELEARLVAVEGDVELGGEGQVEAALARCMGLLHRILARSVRVEGGFHKLKQVFAGLVADEKRGDRLGQCLRLGDQQALRVSSRSRRPQGAGSS